jgi:FkbM family methyltransferase
MTPRLLAELLRDTHRYAPGVEHRRPALVDPAERTWRRAVRAGRERFRDLLERVAEQVGFSHAHFDPDDAGERLARLLELSRGLEATYARLGDEASRRAMIDVLKLRVLGPFHVSLAITPEAYRAKQAYVERRLRAAHGTFEVSDPWFSPLSLYSAPVDGDAAIRLHSHSVDVVSVFLLGQYRYNDAVGPRPGDVVLDVGGCWGDTALYFAGHIGPAGKVYTFEFDPESLGILQTNLRLNPELAGRIEVVERALWHSSGETLEFVPAGRCTSVAPGDSDPSRPTTRTVSVDDFIAERRLERVDFIKVDVEGAEMNVLDGARQALERFAPRLAIAAYHHDDDLVRIPQAIVALNRDYQLYLASFSPVEEETVLFAVAPGPPA